MQGADRSAANDIWSVGATFVHMISGQPVNHLETVTQLILNISQYKICIKGNSLNNYLQTLNDSEFKKKVISRTLCNEPNRANGQQLLRILFPHSKRLPAEALMAAGDWRDPDIYGMSYNSARDELFLADNNGVVRAMRVRDNAGDLRDVYRAPPFSNIYSVCHRKLVNFLCELMYFYWKIFLFWKLSIYRPRPARGAKTLSGGRPPGPTLATAPQ